MTSLRKILAPAAALLLLGVSEGAWAQRGGSVRYSGGRSMSIERVNAATAGRPDLMAGRTSLTVYEGMTGMSENVFINTKNRSHSIVAEILIPKGGANGVVISQAGRFGGWSLYLRQGVPVYTYNFLGLESYSVAAKSPLPVGKVTLRYDFAYDGGGLGKGGVGTLQVNGKQVAQGRIQRTHFNIFSADEGADVGEDAETAVTNYKGMPAPFRFTGKVNKITIQLKTPDEAFLSAEKAAQAEANHKKSLSD